MKGWVTVLRWLVVGSMAGVAVLFLAVGGWRVASSSKRANHCTMTYMGPRYSPLPVPRSPHATKYSLVLYREGGQANTLVLLLFPGFDDLNELQQ